MSIKLIAQGTTGESDIGTSVRRQQTGAEQFQHKSSCKFQSRLNQHSPEGEKRIKYDNNNT